MSWWPAGLGWFFLLLGLALVFWMINNKEKLWWCGYASIALILCPICFYAAGVQRGHAEFDPPPCEELLEENKTYPLLRGMPHDYTLRVDAGTIDRRTLLCQVDGFHSPWPPPNATDVTRRGSRLYYDPSPDVPDE